MRERRPSTSIMLSMEYRMNRGFKFTSKKLSDKGIMATVLGIVAMISFFVANTYSFRQAGNIDLRMASAGILSFIFAFVGDVLAALSFYEPDTFLFVKIMGSVVCGIATILWVVILLIGTGVIVF